MRRVVITGIGLVGPTGIGPDAFWRSLIDGCSGIGPITRFDATSYPCRIGGEVKDRSYEELIDPRKRRITTHVTQLGLAAAELALRDAHLPNGRYEPTMTGVMVGTALGGWREGEQQYGILLERGIRRVNPFVANGAPSHNPGIEIAATVNAQGPHVTFSTGCSSSLQAIGYGASLIERGDLDICLAGGVESPLSPVVLASMARTQELSTRNDEPERASRPFDAEHSGLVLSEGGCFFLLESLEGAVRRGVRPYGEVIGLASSCDAKGVYGVDATGEAAAHAIHRLLKRSGKTASDLDYICAHANSSPAFDIKETVVLKRAFGEFAEQLPVSSIKGIVGHSLGASGAFELAAAVLAIRHQTIPPTHNLETPAPECDLDYVPGSPRPAPLRTVLITNYGYGGVNTYLLVAATS